MKAVLSLIFALTFAGTIPAKEKKAVTAPSAPSALTPPMGSEDRAAIMDGLRAWVKKKQQLEVVFTVRELKVKDGWAWASVTPKSKDGENNYEAINGLLRQDKSGSWRVTDVEGEEISNADNPTLAEKTWLKGLLDLYPNLPPEILPLASQGDNEDTTPRKPKEAVNAREVGKADPERKAILDAMRPEVERLWDTHDVVFIVNLMRVAGPWAWVEAVPTSKDGRNKLAPATALLRKENGEWLLLEIPEWDKEGISERADRAAKLLRRYPELPDTLFGK